MKRELFDLLCCPDCKTDLYLQDATPREPEILDGALVCGTCRVSFPIVRGIPRFVGSDAYVGSFSYEWNRWHRVQLDTANGRTESEDTFAEKTGFTPADLAGKLVLDVGCGAGRFLDVASRWGATVIGIDLSFAVEASQQNLGSHPNVSVIQADVFRLPFREKTFDHIFSIGVLHHSRDTRQAFLQLPPLLKDGGDIAVWLYYYTDKVYNAASDFWRAVCRPFPSWAVYAWCWLIVTLFSGLWARPIMARQPWRLFKRLLPVNTHPDRQWRILDTFDWYTPRYQDKECSAARVVRWCEESHIRDIRILDYPTAIRGRRDPAGSLPLVHGTLPDVRTKRVLVFGAGAGGRLAVEFVQTLAPGAVVGVVDNDPRKHGTTIDGFAVRAFADVPRHAYDLVAIASIPGLKPIASQLAAAGLIPGIEFVSFGLIEQALDVTVDFERRAA